MKGIAVAQASALGGGIRGKELVGATLLLLLGQFLLLLHHVALGGQASDDADMVRDVGGWW